jgi:hypothetical protein
MNTVLFVLSALVAALVALLRGLNFPVGETPPAQTLAVAAVLFHAATVLAAPVPAPSAGFAAAVNGLPSCAVSPYFTAGLCMHSEVIHDEAICNQRGLCPGTSTTLLLTFPTIPC